MNCIKKVIVNGIIITSVLFFLPSKNQGIAQDVNNSTQPLLLSPNNCTTSGSGQLVEEESEVSIGKKFFLSKFYMSNGSNSQPLLLTCNIDQATKNSTLLLNFGIKDYAITRNNSSNNMTLKIFLDGREESMHTLSPGENKKILIDVSKSEAVALEMLCLAVNRHCYRTEPNIYFSQADFYPEPINSFEKTQGSLNTIQEKANINYIIEESSWGRERNNPQEDNEAVDNSNENNSEQTNRKKSPDTGLENIINDVLEDVLNDIF